MMAARIRADRKTIVCAAKSEAELGDCYLDDSVHYSLCEDFHILHWIGCDENGADLWAFGADEDWLDDGEVEKVEVGAK